MCREGAKRERGGCVGRVQRGRERRVCREGAKREREEGV